LLHAWLSWPSNVETYCAPGAFRLNSTPVRAAFRLESEDEYLARSLDGYAVARRVEKETPPGSRIFAFDNPPEAYCAREILVSFQAGLNERLRYTVYAGFDPEFQPLGVLTFHVPAVRVRRLRLVQAASDRVAIPGISEIEIFGPEGPLPRSPGWRIHARPFPWDAELAFDGNLATQWRAWRQIESGAVVEVDFGGEVNVTEVRLHRTPDQAARWRLEGQDTGRWSVLSADPVASVDQKMDLRRAAMAEFRRNHVGYILLADTEFAGPDFRNNTGLWGARLLSETGKYRLYQIR
jgi:hypothetical protein